MTERLNFYSGTFSLDPQNANQIAAELGNFDDELSDIEYIADIHVRREDLIRVINAVRIRYAYDLTGDDFLQTISGTDDTTSLESIRTYQDASERANADPANPDVVNIRSFDMNYTGEVLGRMPTQLKGKYVTYNDTGADSFVFGVSRNVVTTVDDFGAQVTGGALEATFNTSTEAAGDLVSLTSGYDNLNLMAGAVARALSSQFPHNAHDQNLLKILVEQSSYENLMKIALDGCTTTTGSTVSIQSLLHSNTVAKGHGINMQDLRDKVFDENLPSSRALGHEILLAIFDKCPASLGDDSGAQRTVAYLGEDNTTDKRPWKVISLEGGSDGDALQLEYAANLVNNVTGNVIDVTLQFVLKTKLTMTLRDGTSLQTLESPDPKLYDSAGAVINVATRSADPVTAIISEGGDYYAYSMAADEKMVWVKENEVGGQWYKVSDGGLRYDEYDGAKKRFIDNLEGDGTGAALPVDSVVFTPHLATEHQYPTVITEVEGLSSLSTGGSTLDVMEWGVRPNRYPGIVGNGVWKRLPSAFNGIFYYYYGVDAEGIGLGPVEGTKGAVWVRDSYFTSGGVANNYDGWRPTPSQSNNMKCWVNMENTQFLVPLVRGDLVDKPIRWIAIDVNETTKWGVWAKNTDWAASWDGLQMAHQWGTAVGPTGPNSVVDDIGDATYDATSYDNSKYYFPRLASYPSYMWVYTLDGTGDRPDSGSAWTGNEVPVPGFSKILLNVIFDRDQ